MHFESIPEVNRGILKNRKVIITIGCSFVEGQGALDQKLWDKYYTPGDKITASEWRFTKQQQEEIISEFPDIFYNTKFTECLNFYIHESNNSFGSILCKKYFNDEYTCINLGRRGNGNRASIKDLYFYPDILWDEIHETIVIYCPSGEERYDFISDIYSNYANHHGRWVAIWPGSYEKLPPYTEDNDPIDIFSYGLNKAIYTSKATTLEQIAHVQELLLWCKYKKAKLIITPAFMPTYTKEVFALNLDSNVQRTMRNKMLSHEHGNFNPSEIEKVVNLWPWDNMFYPDGHSNFADLVMAQEKSLDLKNDHFYSYANKGTPDKWITPCAHPSAKGHDLFAQYLHKHILTL